jgi:hypothetical protein
MEKIKFTIFLLLVFGLASFGQDNLVPGDYKPISEKFGDLDKDGVEERVVVYNMDTVQKFDGVDREIIAKR